MAKKSTTWFDKNKEKEKWKGRSLPGGRGGEGNQEEPGEGISVIQPVLWRSQN